MNDKNMNMANLSVGYDMANHTDHTGMCMANYRDYMKMNFDNESRHEFLTKHMNIPIEKEEK